MSLLLTDLPFYDALLILTTTVDAFNTGSTTIIIPPLTVIERQLQEDSLKYGIEVLVGSQVGSEFRAFSKPLHHLQICVKYVPRLLMAPLHRCQQKNLRRQ